MVKCPHNKNVSTIKTNLVGSAIEKDVSSLLASILVSSATNNHQDASVGNCRTDSDNVHQLTPIRMVKMKDDVSHEVDEIVITDYLRFALDDVESNHPVDMSTIDCNQIRIGTFITENEDPLHYVLTLEHPSQ